MKRAVVVGLSTAALLSPALGTLSTAEAQTSGVSRNLCHKTEYGTTVLIEVVNLLEAGKVRVYVSHKDATGKFRNSHVRRTLTAVYRPGPSIDAGRASYAFTVKGDVTKVKTAFKIKHHRKKVYLSCSA